MIAEQSGAIYAERPQEEGQVQIEERLVDMLQLKKNAASSGMKTSSVHFPENETIELLSHRAIDDVILQCFQRWSQSDRFMNTFIKRIEYNPLVIRLVAGLIRKHVNATIKEFSLTQLFAETGEVDKERVPLPSARSLSNERQSPKTRATTKALWIKGGREKKGHSDSPDYQKDWTRISPVAQGHDFLGIKIESCIKAMT